MADPSHEQRLQEIEAEILELKKTTRRRKAHKVLQQVLLFFSVGAGIWAASVWYEGVNNLLLHWSSLEPQTAATPIPTPKTVTLTTPWSPSPVKCSEGGCLWTSRSYDCLQQHDGDTDCEEEPAESRTYCLVAEDVEGCPEPLHPDDENFNTANDPGLLLWMEEAGFEWEEGSGRGDSGGWLRGGQRLEFWIDQEYDIGQYWDGRDGDRPSEQG